MNHTVFDKLPSAQPGEPLFPDQVLGQACPRDMNELCSAIAACYARARGEDEEPLFPPGRTQFDSLAIAIKELEDELAGFRMFGDSDSAAHHVLPFVFRFAHRLPELFPQRPLVLPLLRQNVAGSVELTMDQVLCIMCHALFCNVGRLALVERAPPGTRRSVPHFGTISFMLLYLSPSRTAIARIKCMLAYYYACMKNHHHHHHHHEQQQESSLADPPAQRRMLRVERHVLTGDGVDWASDAFAGTQLCDVDFSDTRLIEDSSARVHVDFANEDLHVGAIWASATQEEVIFSIRPELFVCILFCETMLDHEAIVMRGSRRYNNYKGYLETFQWTGLSEQAMDALGGDDGGETAVLAIDSAIVESLREQFEPENMLRDLNKAFVGFSGALGTGVGVSAAISTGNWGCGCFGNDPIVKCVQQVIAASAAGCPRLDYCVYGNAALAESLKSMLKTLRDNDVSVQGAYELLRCYGEVLPKLEKQKIMDLTFMEFVMVR